MQVFTRILSLSQHELLLLCEAIAQIAANSCRLQSEFFRQLSGAGVPQNLAFAAAEVLADDTVPTRRTPQQQAAVDAAHAIIQASDPDLLHLFLDAESFDFDFALAE